MTAYMQEILYTHTYIQKISEGFKKRKERESNWKIGIGEIDFSSYTRLYLLNFQLSRNFLLIKIVMINIIGKYTRISSTGSLIYRKKLKATSISINKEIIFRRQYME